MTAAPQNGPAELDLSTAAAYNHRALALGMLLHPERGLMTERRSRRSGPWRTSDHQVRDLLAGELLLLLSVPAVVTNWRLIGVRNLTAGGMVFGAVLLGMGVVGLLSVASGLRSMQRSTTS